MRRLFKEPLLHFLLLGAALFVAFTFVSDRDRPDDAEIVVSAGKIEHLAALFARTWQRPPTRDELDGLIADFVREEVAYREGVANGFDRDDTIIRRRIRQKLDFIAEELAGQLQPTDAELATYLTEHLDDFRVAPRLSFRHVYLSPDRRGATLETDAAALLAELEGNPNLDARALGDRILLEHGYADVSVRDVTGLFGNAFSEAIIELEPGQWHGPIPSGYGVHLVRVDERTQGRTPELQEVRDVVLREWNNARRLEVSEKFYRDLLARYTVTIEWPDLIARDDSS